LLAFLPFDSEVALPNAIADPVISHIDHFRLSLLDGVVRDASSGGVVGY